jgi:hypothetical protein
MASRCSGSRFSHSSISNSDSEPAAGGRIGILNRPGSIGGGARTVHPVKAAADRDGQPAQTPVSQPSINASTVSMYACGLTARNLLRGPHHRTRARRRSTEREQRRLRGRLRPRPGRRRRPPTTAPAGTRDPLNEPGSSMLAITCKRPSQRAHRSISIPNTRFSRRTRLVATCSGASCSGAVAPLRDPARRPAGVIAARSAAGAAQTP